MAWNTAEDALPCNGCGAKPEFYNHRGQITLEHPDGTSCDLRTIRLETSPEDGPEAELKVQLVERWNRGMGGADVRGAAESAAA